MISLLYLNQLQMLPFQCAFRKADNSSLHTPSCAVIPLEPQLGSYGNNYKKGPAFPRLRRAHWYSLTGHRSKQRSPGLPCPLCSARPCRRSTPRPSGTRGLRAGAPGAAARSRYRAGGPASPAPTLPRDSRTFAATFTSA